MTIKTTITSDLLCQGSYGLRDINRANGTDNGTIMRVWHVIAASTRLESYLTRDEARKAQAKFAASADTPNLIAARNNYRHTKADEIAHQIVYGG